MKVSSRAILKGVLGSLLLCHYTAVGQTQSPPQASYDSINQVMQFDWESDRNRTFFPQVTANLENWTYAGALHFGQGSHVGMIQSDAPKTFLRLRYSDLPVASEAEAESADFDLDGLTNIQELQQTHTDPLDNDSDNDGLPDGWEVAHAISPFDDGSIDPANGPDGVFEDPEAPEPEGFVMFSSTTATTNAGAFGSGVQAHPDATLADKDGDGIPNGRDAGALTRAIDWETDNSLPRFIFQSLPGYNYSTHGSIVGCNSVGDVVTQKAFYSNGVWQTLGTLPFGQSNYLPQMFRINGEDFEAYAQQKPVPTSVSDAGKIVGHATVFLSISNIGTQMAFVWDSPGATPRLLAHPGSVIEGSWWDELAQIAQDGSYVIRRRTDPSNYWDTTCRFDRYDANGVMASTQGYPVANPALVGPQGFQAFNIGNTNAFGWIPGAAGPISLFAEATFTTPNPRSHYFSEPTFAGVKPGPPGGYCLNFWDKTMIRHEGRWHEAADLQGVRMLTEGGIGLKNMPSTSVSVWKGGQTRTLAASVINENFTSRNVSPRGNTAAGDVLIEYYGAGVAPFSAGYLLPADVASLDRYVEVGISTDSIRALGGMDQVAIRLKSADGNEIHGITSGDLNDAIIHSSEAEMLSDSEIASYRTGHLDAKCYNDAAQDSAIWMEGNKLKFATVFNQAGPIKIEFVSGGNVVATIDYTLTPLEHFSDLIDVLDSTLAEIPFQTGPPVLALNAPAPQMAPMSFLGNLLRRNLVTKCMRSVYSTVKQHVVEGVAAVTPGAIEALKIAALGGQGFVQGLWAGVKDDYEGIVGGIQLFGSMITSPVETAGSFTRGFKELLGLSWAQLSQIPKNMAQQFMAQATQNIAWTGPVDNFDLSVYVVTYTTGFLTEKVGLAIITGGASAAASGIAQGANFAVKFTAIVSKIRTGIAGGEKLINAVSVVSNKVQALSAMKAKTFRKLSQYVDDKTQVAALRQYLELKMRPCAP